MTKVYEQLVECANRYLSFEAEFLMHSDAKKYPMHPPKKYSDFGYAVFGYKYRNAQNQNGLSDEEPMYVVTL